MPRVLAALLLVAAAAARAAGDEPAGGDRPNFDYLKGWVYDAGDILSSPARWDRADWLEAGALAGADAGLYFGVDVAARKAALRDQSRAASDAADAGQVLGNGLYVVPGLAVAYLGG